MVIILNHFISPDRQHLYQGLHYFIKRLKGQEQTQICWCSWSLFKVKESAWSPLCPWGPPPTHRGTCHIKTNRLATPAARSLWQSRHNMPLCSLTRGGLIKPLSASSTSTHPPTQLAQVNPALQPTHPHPLQTQNKSFTTKPGCAQWMNLPWAPSGDPARTRETVRCSGLTQSPLSW